MHLGVRIGPAASEHEISWFEALRHQEPRISWDDGRFSDRRGQPLTTDRKIRAGPARVPSGRSGGGPLRRGTIRPARPQAVRRARSSPRPPWIAGGRAAATSSSPSSSPGGPPTLLDGSCWCGQRAQGRQHRRRNAARTRLDGALRQHFPHEPRSDCARSAPHPENGLLSRGAERGSQQGRAGRTTDLGKKDVVRDHRDHADRLRPCKPLGPWASKGDHLQSSRSWARCMNSVCRSRCMNGPRRSGPGGGRSRSASLGLQDPNRPAPRAVAAARRA